MDNIIYSAYYLPGLLKRRKKARMDPPPAPSSSTLTTEPILQGKQVKAEAIAAAAPELAVA
jgi:hypothetical protein